ncbi:hypothetical protein C6Y14_05595 [Streptomyces dioscori]|uniref:Uncharacterized protein n=1 Tax=Streptomyces dioscori TaxID=2109333 RepID=A0A2P8QE39_9ACTN|nr:hypothetical protein C6Y14_05595 [Streptomyces dioscori]
MEFQHDDRTYTKVVTRLTVDVPPSWPLAQDLLLSEDSRRYIKAMACLTRSEQKKQQRHWAEWRVGNPVVVSKGGRVKVVDKAHSWVDEYRSEIEVGVWSVRTGAERWFVRLQAPPALAGARWERITVDPGKPGAELVKPKSYAGQGATALVWRFEAMRQQKRATEKTAGEVTEKAKESTVPSVTVWLRPSWQRSWAAQNGRLIALGMSTVGTWLWTIVVAVLLLAAARSYGARSAVPTSRQRGTRRNLIAWAWCVVAVDVMTFADDLINPYVQRRSDNRWLDEWILHGHGFALVIVLLLLAFARPPHRIWSAAGLLALLPLAEMKWPERFDLRPLRVAPMDYVHTASDKALAAQTASACCVMAVTLLAFAAAAWRLATDGQLLPESRQNPGTDRVLRLRIALPAVLGATVVIAVCAALAHERSWQRASWLSDPVDAAYGNDHRINLLWDAMWSVSNGQDWIVGYTYLLTAVAVLAALRAWHISSALSPVDRQGDRAERLLFLTFFPVGVGLGGGLPLGVTLPTSVWIPLHMLALYWAVTLFARRSVLAQPLVKSDRPLAVVLGPGVRAELLARARTYRETHAALRRLDQGLFGDQPPVRETEERNLSDLHQWPAGGVLTAPDRLPPKVSVVDAALALGPRDTWWANGSRAARLALIPGLPAAALTTWVWTVRGEAWESTLSDQFGFPGMVLVFVYWMVTWAGAGFVLGALWRVLPGRRGAVKAIPVTLAFALPAGLDALLSWFTGESVSNLALHVSAMLFVLTVTGIAFDLDTFQGERRYWQSRLGLLLSVYQMRYYSLQVAYLVAQIIAMISIWQFFAEPAVTPEPPEGK